jgi:hypothetical protein
MTAISYPQYAPYLVRLRRRIAGVLRALALVEAVSMTLITLILSRLIGIYSDWGHRHFSLAVRSLVHRRVARRVHIFGVWLHAAHVYSWMRPPSRSRRLTAAWDRERSAITCGEGWGARSSSARRWRSRL